VQLPPASTAVAPKNSSTTATAAPRAGIVTMAAGAAAASSKQDAGFSAHLDARWQVLLETTPFVEILSGLLQQRCPPLCRKPAAAGVVLPRVSDCI
jgi:hypothetical protein